MSAFDASMASVTAACLNDPNKNYPNLMLVQKLWDEPEQVLALADPTHPLYATGLVRQSAQAAPFYAEMLWEQPLTVPAPVAAALLFPATAWPGHLSPWKSNGKAETKLGEEAHLLAYRLRAEKAEALRIVPLLGAKGSAWRETARAMARLAKREVVEFTGHGRLLESEAYLNALATLCWLRDADLALRYEEPDEGHERHGQSERLPLASIPLNLWLSITERKQLAHIPDANLLPAVSIAPLTYHERVRYWTQQLGAKARGHEGCINEISRRFRYEKETIRVIAQELKALPGKLAAEDFFAACRAELQTDLGELASKVTPRFYDEKLILPHKQLLQFEEQLNAMRSLTQVHYEWGTAQAWNESGISVLFAGPPGTGKTMAAEIMAIRLDLPMYRIDLSQVVNKYIGETEKNLKRIFDAADISDMILFFDEADSLFGRRTEVSDAHDRYANLEISYLLERMERFKGLAILATNRKKDLDEAFLRRLRYIIDFPLPDEEQRKQIWQQVTPAGADSSHLDFDFLARQFPLAGGNIRSIVFNACLQSAAGDETRQNADKQLSMKDVLIAVKRECDKMNRSVSAEQFGHYAQAITNLEQQP
ncbi:MAG: ATP-binding protein [Acidobacteria bacterium]|nr:ATP-binding protein [Acidobacteriota bacterium]